MPADPKKLKAFADGGDKDHGGGGGGGHDDHADQEHHDEPGEGSEHDQEMDANDNMSRESMMHRLQEPQVGYMEIQGGWGQGGCANCKHLIEGAFCINQQVTSYVSEKDGCCNFMEPTEEVKLTMPEDWDALSDVE